MRLTPGTQVTVLLNGEERCFILVAADGNGNERLNVAAPLAVQLGMMVVGDLVKAWTPCVAGAEPMRVKLVKVI